MPKFDAKTTTVLPSGDEDNTFLVRVITRANDDVMSLWGLDENIVMINRNQAAGLRDVLVAWLAG